MHGQENLERTWKVRERSGNLKINGYGSLQKIYLFCSKGDRMYFLMSNLSTSPSSLRATQKGKNFLHSGANSSL